MYSKNIELLPFAENNTCKTRSFWKALSMRKLVLRFFFLWQIHWFSIFNSFMIGLVSMILMRTLRKDYARYSKEDDLDDMVSFLFLKAI